MYYRVGTRDWSIRACHRRCSTTDTRARPTRPEWWNCVTSGGWRTCCTGPACDPQLRAAARSRGTLTPTTLSSTSDRVVRSERCLFLNRF